MAIGTPPSRAVLDQTLGEIAADARRLLLKIEYLNEWVDGTTDAVLPGPQYGYSAGEVTELRDAANQLDFLRRVTRGEMIVPVPTDARPLLSKIGGFSF